MIQENCSTFTCDQERHIQTLFRLSVDLALVVPGVQPGHVTDEQLPGDGGGAELGDCDQEPGVR